jgi:probable F420-dependent oxidoreductase
MTRPAIPDFGEVGVWTFSLELQPAGAAREAAARLEDLGFRLLWISDSRRRDVLVNAALLLSATRRLAVATGIASIYGRDPMTMAFSAKTLAEAFPGRFVLGLGVSHRSIVEGQRGHAYGPGVATMRHYLQAMSEAEYLSPEPPAGGCPVILGALGPKMLELARELTSGAHPYHTTPEHTHRARTILGPGAFLAPELPVVFDTDPASARALARSRIGNSLRHPAYVSNLLRLGFTEDDFAGGGSDRLIDSLVAWGDEPAITKRIREHLAAGADHVAVQVIPADERSLPFPQWMLLAEAFSLART